jgi:hypothetical protein
MKNWVKCAVLTGNSTDIRTVIFNLSHRELRSSLRESHSFLGLPADTTWPYLKALTRTEKKLQNWWETCAVPENIQFSFLYSFVTQLNCNVCPRVYGAPFRNKKTYHLNTKTTLQWRATFHVQYLLISLLHNLSSPKFLEDSSCFSVRRQLCRHTVKHLISGSTSVCYTLKEEESL